MRSHGRRRPALRTQRRVTFANIKEKWGGIIADTTHSRLTLSDIAERLHVELETVYKLRTASQKHDGPFPRPVGFDRNRPLFDEIDVDAYIASRRAHTPAGAGRRSRIHVDDSDAFAARLRQAIVDGAGLPDIPTQAELIRRLGLNIVTFGNRMRGTTAWKPAELDLIGNVLNIDTDDANDTVTHHRQERRANRARSSSES
ncbi:MAG: helix-turn-helix transcriptional regulator [Microbacterium sp.]